MKLEFAVGMGRNERMDEIGDHARVAEESGFTYVTFVDQPYISRDVFASMTIAALNTRRVRIGQGVIDPYSHHPLVIAGATASINELSGGRAFVGIGAGGPFGKVMRPRPLKDLREAIELIKRFTAGEEIELDGQRIRSEFCRQQVPVYMAASGPRSLQMAGEIADGVMPTSSFGVEPIMMKWKLEQIEKGALKAGRDPSEIDVWARAMIYVTNSKGDALREVAGYAANSAGGVSLFERETPELADLRQRLEHEYPGLLDDCQRVRDARDPRWHEHIDSPAARMVTQRIVDAFHLVGTPDEICEKLHRLQQLGIKTVATVTYTIIDKKGVMREIGDRIMPHFRN